MHRTRIKICGITTLDDALVAVSAGADAIGLIFHAPAKRNIDPERAAEIVRKLPPFVTPVGLFLDAPAFRIESVARAVGLQWVQLHGHEKPEDVRELQRLNVIKAIHVMPGKLNVRLELWRPEVGTLNNLRGLVLETGWGAAKGGTGIENDWEEIQTVKDRGGLKGLPPIILAGGLKPRNVGSVVEMLCPHAVDVSSGVEAEFGHKSPELAGAFIKAVYRADQTINQLEAESASSGSRKTA